MQRPSKVFGTIYLKLFAFYKHIISDSSLNSAIIKRLYMLDSTTISLFKAILKSQAVNEKMEKVKEE